MKSKRIIIFIIGFGLLIAACDTEGRFQAIPTSEPTGTQTPKPGQTPTPTLIPTPTYTPAPTAVPISTGQIVTVRALVSICNAPIYRCQPLKTILKEEEVEIISYEGRDWYKVRAKGLTDESPPFIGYLLADEMILPKTSPTPGK